MNTSVLLWSAVFDGLDGQALVTSRVANHQSVIAWKRAIYRAGGGWAMFSVVGATFKAWKWIATGRTNTAYVVCSRSTLGFVRDLPILLTTLLGVRLVVHTHGSDLLDLVRRAYIGWLARALYRRCEVVAPSSHMLGDLRRLPCRAVHLCENFTVRQTEPAVSRRSAGETLHVLWNSNVLATKGIRELVAGLRLAREGGVPVRLTVLGRPLGDAEASAEEMSGFLDGLRGESWVDIRGPVPPSRVRELIRTCDLVALPSRYSSECQPLAVIDAMCAGREVLVANTPALQATVGAYPAHIVTGDPVSIAIALESIASSHPNRSEELVFAAVQAQSRFCVARFDREIQEILLTPSIRAPSPAGMA